MRLRFSVQVDAVIQPSIHIEPWIKVTAGKIGTIPSIERPLVPEHRRVQAVGKPDERIPDGILKGWSAAAVGYPGVLKLILIDDHIIIIGITPGAARPRDRD